MDKGRGGQDRLMRTMGRPGPAMTLLLLSIAFLTLRSVSDAAAISPRLPTKIVMTAIVVAEQDPLNLDLLSLYWEHDGRLLVEYTDSHVTSYHPRVSMPREQFKDGNFSLILNNITIKDTGNYTCLIEYNKEQQIIQYILRVEKNRIQLLNLSAKKVEENIDNNARESSKPTSGWFLNMGGYKHVVAKPGENISLMCKFHTDPSMELTMLNIRWSKDGVTKWIYNNNLLENLTTLEELSKGNANLNLTSIQRKDSGKYTCNIKYRSLEKNFSTIVIVRDNDKEDAEYLSLLISLQENNSMSTMINTDRYRKEKIAVVVGVIAVANCLAFFVYFCVAV
ncbi:uncharacterized protein ACMZJ9_010229 isoform 2-T2 [Mantella aurantiaca]